MESVCVLFLIVFVLFVFDCFVSSCLSSVTRLLLCLGKQSPHNGSSYVFGFDCAGLLLFLVLLDVLANNLYQVKLV
jgi:hypothetical protein